MNIIEYDSQKELNDFIRYNFVKALGSGREGSCFLMPDGSVIKTIDSNYYYVEWLEKFKDIQIPNFYFANGGILVNSFVKAIFQDYAHGEIISKVDFKKCDFDSLRNALTELKKSIIELSKEKIKITDIFFGNILFDGNSFSLIDTQGYEFNNDIDLVNYNLCGVIREIYKYIFTQNFLICEFIKKSKYRDYLYNYNLLSQPEELFDWLEEYFNKDIKNLGEIELKLKLNVE